MKLNVRQMEVLSCRLWSVEERMIGNLMEIVEVLGLPETQERAFKNAIKTKIYHVVCDEVNIFRNFGMTKEARNELSKMKNPPAV